MKKIFLLLFLAIAGVIIWYFLVTRKKPDVETPQQQPLAVSQHSAAFNQAINGVLNYYYNLSEALVNWDSAAVKTQAAELKKEIDSLSFNELQKDTVIYQTAASYKDMFQKDVNVLSGDNNLTEKRLAFNTLSQNMYDLLRTIQYDDQKVYLQQCPMAFNDTETGLWLSKSEGIRNPYLGLHHPKYKSGMLECGETKETLNFAAAAQ
jgi:hypothetical protein